MITVSITGSVIFYCNYEYYTTIYKKYYPTYGTIIVLSSDIIFHILPLIYIIYYDLFQKYINYYAMLIQYSYVILYFKCINVKNQYNNISYNYLILLPTIINIFVNCILPQMLTQS